MDVAYGKSLIKSICTNPKNFLWVEAFMRHFSLMNCASANWSSRVLEKKGSIGDAVNSRMEEI